MSDTEFKAKPLTAKETLTMNAIIAAVVVFMFGVGTVMFHYHTDTVSPYAAAPAPTPVKKL